MTKLIWKIYTAILVAVIAIVARQLLTLAWRTVTGSKPPSSPADPKTPVASAVSWVLASGIGVGVARLFAQRFAARQQLDATGERTGFEPGEAHPS
jgi:hypothetical protein